MNDWKIEIIIRLLQIIDRLLQINESAATSANESKPSDDDRLADEVARLKHQIFGDPYPPNN